MSFFRLLTRAIAAIFTLPVIYPVCAATITSETIVRPEGIRGYLLAQPTQAHTGKLPLVIVLHGNGASVSMTFGKEKINDPAAAWLDLVDREHLLVLAPDGWKGSNDKQGWNDCRADAPTNPKTDDVGFLSALIDKAIAEHNADPNQIFITGASNGGTMTYRAAIELGPRLAAVSVSSALMSATSLCQSPKHPLPILFMHGTDDKIAPYAGGVVGHRLSGGRGSGIGMEESIKIWRELAQLPESPTVTAIPHRDKSDVTSATRYVWGNDTKQLQIAFLKITKGGHVQPSISRRLSWIVVAFLGEQNADVEFAEETWAFFKDKRGVLVPAVK